MLQPAFRSVCLLLVLVLAARAPAQLAGSAGVRLEALSLDGAGGGIASLDIAAHFALGDLSGGELVSPNYAASIGFLAANDPQVTNLPVVFGIDPYFGPLAGGTAITLTGLNFDKFGQGGSIGVAFGGASADDVVVHSGSLITLTSPPGASGPADVVVSDSLGSTTWPGGFVYTPAITTTPIVPIGGELDIRNYGPLGASFLTIVSLTSWSAHMKFGTLLIGPDFFLLIAPRVYPEPDGVATLPIIVPQDSALVGLTVYFQSLCITQMGPLQGSLTNASTVSIP